MSVNCFTAQRRPSVCGKWRKRYPGVGAHTSPLRASFVGREREFEEVRRLLATTRLLTLTGSGGIGKTRLALHVSADRAATGEEVAVVELAPVLDPGLVGRSVATALRITEPPDRAVLDVLVDLLGGRRMLLLMDNCEHVLSGCADVLEGLRLSRSIGDRVAEDRALEHLSELESRRIGERDHASGPRRGGLSPREIQVLCLAARGQTNREIAEQLVLGDKTVKRHLDNVYAKLGIRSRAAAAAYAVRAGLAV
ncbi:MAG: hypothetical protein JO352_24560 [Chloroflexi bacterium]|nr:hypothetical protein [Chloroflexota bacterium]MBV9600743.1 hypothetical protein [Chloroflexota bacterium]